VDLKPHLQRLGFAGPKGGYNFALLIVALGAIALWLGFGIAVGLLVAFGEH
jgi:hypothetical protein